MWNVLVVVLCSAPFVWWFVSSVIVPAKRKKPRSVTYSRNVYAVTSVEHQSVPSVSDYADRTDELLPGEIYDD